MKRKFALGLILVLLSLFSLTTYAQDGGTLTTVSQGVRLRGGPGTDWKLLGSLEAGAAFLIDGRAPGGGWVRGITSDGKVGWIVETSVGLNADQLNALPSVWVDTPFTLGAPGGGAPAPAQVDQQPADAGQPASAPALPPPEGGLIVATGNTVKMRALPSTDGAVILTLKAGTQFSAVGRDASQDWVRGVLGDGTAGWISVRFVTISAQQLVSLPVTDAAGSIAAVPPAPAGDAGQPTAPPPVAVEPLVNTAPVKGFSFGGHVDGFGDATVQRMHQAGMTWAKRQWRYRVGQNPADVAGMINDAHAKGFRILIGIVGFTDEVNNGGYFDNYAAFVGGVAAQGADAIEVWNEMNIDREWPSGSIDPGSYTNLLAKSYNAIKGANSNTLVISGAPAPTGYFGGCSAAGCDDNAYIAGMAAAGAANYMDCIGLHYNEGILGPTQTSGDPRGSSGYYTRYFSGMVNTYSRAFGGRRPLCFTELGYLTPEGLPPLPGAFGWAANVTLGQQASWVDQAVSLAGRSGKVRLLIIWNVDFTQYGDDPMAGYAIIRPDGSCPACDALAS
ncbi:MAG: hypothetical protein ABI690_22790 [Chloroflexota bacterium]